MQIVRTVLWVILLITLIVFSMNNWEVTDIKIWENLVLETKKPALVIVSFLAGLVPMWLLHRGNSWRLHRRINALESAAKIAALGSAADDPAGGTDGSAESSSEPDGSKIEHS